MLLVALLLAAATLPRSFAEERDLLDRRLRAVQRALPDGMRPAGELDSIRALANAAQLQGVSVSARPATDAPGHGDLTVDLVAYGRFTSVETFFRQAALAPRLIDVVSVALAQTPEETLRMTAVLRLPYWPTQSRLPAAPEGTQERVRGVPRPLADAFVHDQALLLAKTDALTELRRTRRSPRMFLSELATAVFDRPVVLTELSWGDELFVVRGLAMGDGPTRALSRRLERGYFRISEILIARQGGCRRFEARGRCPIVGPDVDLPVAHDDPFRPDESPCRVDRDPASAQTVRAAAGKKSPPGPLVVRGRELDAADFFFVLQQLTGQSFLVDENVRQRLNVDLLGLTLEETLAAVAKSKIYAGAPAAMRRVSSRPLPSPRATPRPTLQPTPTPQPTDDASASASTDSLPPPRTDLPPRLSLLVKRATVREILGALAQAEPNRTMVAPPGTLGRLSVWARDVELPLLRASILDAAGLIEVPREDGVTALVPVDAPSPADQTLTPIEPSPTLRRLTLRPADVSPDDFELAAIGGWSGTWRAFSYSPEGMLHVYRTGDALADGSVKSVEGESVVVEGEDGAVWLRLQPLP